MDKYERMIIAVIVIIVLSVVLYFVLLFTGFIKSKFPFSGLIPSWFVIFIPIINQKRLEKEKKSLSK
ncbi:MAG: hypothetical protein EU542_00415 [Promethearchaeota archaeon]|nr:MAG: hypothetical protein EU542_00415 [Candidatus Lokiarchaeota archaeon]